MNPKDVTSRDAATAETFALMWSQVAMPSGAAVTSTLHRSDVSVGGLDRPLPSITVGAGGECDLVELERLGAGGMGTVDAAREGVLDRTVAVKRPRTDAGPRAAAALIAEARILARLDHPNVVPVHALGRDGVGSPVLVMKRVSGRPWGTLAADGTDVERHVGIARRVADALRFAHSRGMLHRDVKPENVMIGDFGEVYLMDWGCSCALVDAVTTEIVGTPVYMAPEMVQVGASIGPWTDTFLLAATLRHVLTGATRNPGMALRDAIEHAWLGTNSPWAHGVPGELAGLLDRAMARDVGDRFPDVESFDRALAGFLAHRAAAKLADTALGVLEELRAELAAKDPRADSLFAQCRFGFRAALEQWPDCPAAREGWQAALAAYIPWKLQAGEPASVEALLPEVEPAAAAAWAREVASLRERRAQVEAAFRDNDLRVGARERRNVMAGMLALAAVAFVGVQRTVSHGEMDAADLAVLGVIPLVLLVAAALPVRRHLLAHRASRSIVLSLLVTLVASASHRLVAWHMNSSVAATIASDCILFALGGFAGAVTVDRLIGVSAVPFVLGAVASLFWPLHASAIFALAAFLSMGVTVAAYVVRARRPAVPAGGPHR